MSFTTTAPSPAGWPRSMPYGCFIPASVADFDGDGLPELTFDNNLGGSDITARNRTRCGPFSIVALRR
jgi:hypothetical protein